ncbi:CHAT domain-containing protein [Stachybotrys elegans]|uniref:CHAT domain-containing protein n=1 Tax=Stachybotrys elegans TaxID=80388 RepID=A0A8K0SIE2_9HYPO|nr:CHAT domain-containing protein [Stachybotrys elegans]
MSDLVSLTRDNEASESELEGILQSIKNTIGQDIPNSTLLGLIKEVLMDEGENDRDLDFVQVVEGSADEVARDAEVDIFKLINEGSREDIDVAIAICQHLDENLPPEYQERVSPSDKLVTSLIEYGYKEKGSRYALISAVGLAKQLYESDSTQKDDTLRSYRATNYGAALGQLYQESGECERLYKSASLNEEAVSASLLASSIINSPKGTVIQSLSPEVNIVNSLAASLVDLFALKGSLDHLNRSIDIMERLVTAVTDPEWSDVRAEWLGNLATSLHRRYELGEPIFRGDLDQAILWTRKALDISAAEPGRRASLCTLAHLLGRRASDTKCLDTLNEAIGILREAMSQYQYPMDIELRVSLAMRIFQRSETVRDRSQTANDLGEAIALAGALLEDIPDDHSQRPHVQNFLGLFHYARFCQFGGSSNAVSALEYFKRALNSPSYPSVFRRVQAGRMMLRLCCDTGRWSEAYRAACDATRLIPKLSSQAIHNRDKERLLSADDIVGFGSDGAAAALNAGENGYAALRLLELARGSLASSILELRADASVLRGKHPELAHKFVELQNQLQDGVSNSLVRRHSASAEFDDLLDEIRKKPGFEGFMLPPGEEDVLEVARDGPVVVLCASTYRGVDAILVEQQGVSILHLECTLQDLETKSSDPKNLQFLKWLWEAISKPILVKLKLMGHSSGEALPRIWWIPTGILSRLPLHAAGHHSAGCTENVMDHAVSSYSSSIKALLQVRRSSRRPVEPKDSKALLIAMRNTPEQGSLPHAAKETDMIRSHLMNKQFRQIEHYGESSLKINVLFHLKTCDVFHFAGHGMENVFDPLKSTLLLHDWKESPLTVECILEQNLHEKRPFLAYLSACKTGSTTQIRFYDESIHLIGAYQLAGFRHVIGTLWSVDDEVSSQIAMATYNQMLSTGEMTDDSVSRSLHRAARQLRDDSQRKRAEGHEAYPRDVVLEDSDEDIRDKREWGWIPFVHYGL